MKYYIFKTDRKRTSTKNISAPRQKCSLTRVSQSDRVRELLRQTIKYETLKCDSCPFSLFTSARLRLNFLHLHPHIIATHNLDQGEHSKTVSLVPYVSFWKHNFKCELPVLKVHIPIEKKRYLQENKIPFSEYELISPSEDSQSLEQQQQKKKLPWPFLLTFGSWISSAVKNRHGATLRTDVWSLIIVL